MPKPPKDPFDVTLSPEREHQLAHQLCDEVEEALQARSTIIAENGDLDYFYAYYEQARMRAKGQGGADLTSFIITESVDAQRARMMKAIFVEPFYIVEGEDAESAKKAPLVEEFHQTQIERERLQSKMGKVLNKALIEGTGVLEVVEGIDKRVVHRERSLALEMDEAGAPILDDKMQPKLQRNPDTHDFVDLTGPGSAQVVVKETITVRRGPQYRVVSLRDFVLLPGHAKDMDEVFGFAKRFTLRMGDLKGKAKQGVYRNIDKLNGTQDTSGTAFETRDGQQMAPQIDDRVEKELFELHVLLDLDEDDIEEWYVLTISLAHRCILRCKHDDLGQPRFLLFTPYPRDDSPYGYSLAGHKLLTLAEEHTALRNMKADRSALATNAPILRVQGALWDPAEQRFGVGAVLDVRDKNELTPMVIPDVPASVIQSEQAIFQAKERVSGQNDLSIAATPQQGRTLGEMEIQTQSSAVRTDESIHYVQETMEDLGQLRHTIWVRTLQGQQGGMTAPDGLVRSLKLRGSDVQDGKITADMIRGNFKFKPRGSVETADLNREGQNLNNWLQTMGVLAQMNPMLQAYWSRPEAVRALIEQGLRVNRVRDRQAFLPPIGPEGDAMLMPQPQVPMLGAGAPPPVGGAGPLPPDVAQAIAAGGGPPA